MVQWLRLRASTAAGMVSIPGRGTKIPHAGRRGGKIKKKRCLGILLFKLFSLEPWGFLGILSNIDARMGEHESYILSTDHLQPLIFCATSWVSV